MSFHRISKPYWLDARAIALTLLFVNNFALPWANIKKNKCQYEYLLSSSKNPENYERQKISSQISKDEYIFALNYDRVEKRGNNFVYLMFDGEVIKYK